MTHSNTKPSHFIVVGGRQRAKALDLDEWHAYEMAVIAEVDATTLVPRIVVEYQTPSHLCADLQPAIVFKAGDVSSDGLTFLVCTQTEVIEFDVRNWKPIFQFSDKLFNDLHHACYDREDPNKIWVANTGLDQVASIRKCGDQSAKIEKTYNACSVPTLERFDDNIDYRKIATTKPHQSHPNYVFQVGGKTFATRFHQSDAINIETGDTVFKIAVGNPHDGILRTISPPSETPGKSGNAARELVSFTTTNGTVISFDSATGKEVSQIDLNRNASREQSLGWCRGLCFESERSMWVGFSRIRPTWLRKNLSWLKQGFQTKGEYGTLPTRIVNVDLKTLAISKEIDLEAIGLNAVFGIYPKFSD